MRRIFRPAVDPMQVWRAAEGLVRARWADYLAAGRDDHSGAFAAYLTALEAEATAAAELELTRRGAAA
jgi:hypothetical protein